MPLFSIKPEVLQQHSMQIEEDIGFFRKEIAFQRIGWIVMFALLLLGSLGLFGTGLLSHKKTIVQGTGLEYEKFLRFENETELIFRLSGASSPSVVTLPGKYTERMRIERIMPEPERMYQANGATHYVFEISGKGVIRFFIAPVSTGSFSAALSVNETQIPIAHFVYP